MTNKMDKREMEKFTHLFYNCKLLSVFSHFSFSLFDRKKKPLSLSIQMYFHWYETKRNQKYNLLFSQVNYTFISIFHLFDMENANIDNIRMSKKTKNTNNLSMFFLHFISLMWSVAFFSFLAFFSCCLLLSCFLFHF